MSRLRYLILALYLLLGTLPLAWMAVTSTKPREAAISRELHFIPASATEGWKYDATLEGYANLATRGSGGRLPSFFDYFANSLLIAGVSTAAAVVLGTMCAYGFSRYKVRGAKDWLFFILSTRFLPPLAVVVPIRLMWVELGIDDTYVGLMVLYTAFNLSLAVWLMKGFIDEIPKAYEEAARVDGYGRVRTLFSVVLPQAKTGMAVTAVFCLIGAMNEYAFALTLNPNSPQTVPVYFAGLQGKIRGVPWPEVAAGAILFVAPVVVFVVLVRNHLLRGVTFGTVKG